MNELLKMENIRYTYEERYVALDDVSVTIHKGERIAILGNNGAGKSTFFLCCNGVLRPQSGNIILKGQPVTTSKQDVTRLRQSVGLVFQEPDSQIIAGTVENEVSFGPMNLKLARGEVERRIALSLAQMNLEGYEARAPQYLSGGEKKRVSIADILAMEPNIILLDEPTASLDPENVELLETTLDSLSKAGMTLLISTHDVDFAYRFAERAIVFSHGKVIADAAIDEVFANDAVLAKASLKKPLLYAAMQLLQEYIPALEKVPKPKNLRAFEAGIAQL